MLLWGWQRLQSARPFGFRGQSAAEALPAPSTQLETEHPFAQLTRFPTLTHAVSLSEQHAAGVHPQVGRTKQLQLRQPLHLNTMVTAAMSPLTKRVLPINSCGCAAVSRP